jgi:LacI family transcriptional regulator
VSDGKPRRAATIEDVAREAGVSRAAVSKVLRNAYGVSEGMRTRVQDAMEQLNYRPSVAARAMRGSSYTLGIEIPEFANQFFTKVIAGATAALRSTPYQLIIAPADSTGPDDELVSEGRHAIEALVDRQVDGIVAVSPLVTQEWLERQAERVPVVMLGRHDDSANYDTVMGDDLEGARLVMEHLFELGHRRIAHLTRDETVARLGLGTPHALRLQCYVDIMTASGREEFMRVERTAKDEKSAYAATVDMLGTGDQPTAIFAGNDELAIGALRAIAEAGADISVAGYDDVPLAAHPLVSLTSVDQSGEKMGERAVQMLLERIAGRTEPKNELFTPVLRARGSTRKPKPTHAEHPSTTA